MNSAFKIPHKPKPHFFVDVDRVLIDFPKMRDGWNERFTKRLGAETLERFKEFYDAHKASWQGTYEALVDQFFIEHADPADVQHVRSIFFDIDYRQFYLPRVIETLKMLHKIGGITIFTQGFTDLQGAKVQPLIDDGVVGAAAICIAKQKTDVIGACLADTGTHQPVVPVVIDDYVEVLEAFRHYAPSAIGVLVYGNHPEQQALIGNAEFPQIVIEQLQDIGRFV